MGILLDDEERRKLLDYPWFDKSNDEYYDIDGLLRAQLKKVVEWLEHNCSKGYIYTDDDSHITTWDYDTKCDNYLILCLGYLETLKKEAGL